MQYPARASVERWIERLLHVHDTPDRTAVAFGLGVTIGFSPLVGLHTALGIVVAFAFNLNRVAVLAGVWLNLPWVLGPYYAGATAFGAWLTGTDMPLGFLGQLQAVWELSTWRERLTGLGHVVRPLLVPYTLGSSLICLVLGAAAYRLSLPILTRKMSRNFDV